MLIAFWSCEKPVSVKPQEQWSLNWNIARFLFTTLSYLINNLQMPISKT